MDVVVRYQQQTGGGGSGARIVGAVLALLGLYLVIDGASMLLGFVLPISDYLHMVLGYTIAYLLPGLVGLALLVSGILLLVRKSGGQGRGITAPNGIAWVLQPPGVLVPLPGREARIPWHQVRFERTQVAGRPGVRCTGPGVDVAYPEAGLSLNHQQLDAEARRISSGG
ncbi:hypothetical protein HJ590_12295 [Naumannella sp. ID2617S]|nr:hypothetical protein [Naumannella sp. ID2617S]